MQQSTGTTMDQRQPHMLDYAIEHPGCACVWVSRDHRTGVEAFRAVVDFLKNTPDTAYWKRIDRINYVSLMLTLKNGSRLYFYDGLSPQQMRGMKIHWAGISRNVEDIETLYADVIRPAQLGVEDTVAVQAHAPLDCYMTSLK